VPKIKNWIIYFEHGSHTCVSSPRWRLFIYLCVGCFTTLSVRDSIEWNGRMVDEWWIEKDLEGSNREIIEVLSWHSPEVTEKNQGNWCLGRDSNRAPPAQESRALPLHHPARFSLFSLFWKKNKVGLWDHVASVCLCILLLLLGNGLVRIPLSLLSNGSVKIPLSLLGNGSVKVPLSLLGNGYIFSAVRVVWKESKRLVLPTTFLYSFVPVFSHYKFEILCDIWGSPWTWRQYVAPKH
jgi:hypothetical protein